MKRSVLLLTNTYPDFKDSYRGIFIKKMAELLHGDGYEVSVVTPKIYTKSRYYEEQNGLKVYRFPFFTRNKLLIEYKKVPYLKMIFYYISGFFFTIYLMVKNHCNLVHVHWAIPPGLIGVWAGRLLRKPIVLTIHGSDFRMARGGSRILKKIFLYVCQRARQIICVSEIQADGIKKMGVEGGKISVIPMGVDERFLEVGKDREKQSNSEGHIVLSNRNLLPLYNVSLLIRAIPKVIHEEPKVKFFIAGDGPERKKLEREVENLNLSTSVKFLGKISHKEMPNLLAQSDIYVSTSPYDGTSVSLLEAMAAGAFPIVTDIPANREWIINGKNGFLVSENEEIFLANKIIDAIRNRDLLRKSQTKNQLIINQKALLSENIKKMKQIYSNILRY